MRVHTLLKLSQACRFNHTSLIPFVRSLHSTTLLMHNVIGIDVGSINTRAVVMCQGQVPTILEMEEGRAIPTVVAINPYLVGQSAKLHALCYPKDVFFNITHLVGTSFKDNSVQRLKSMVPFNIVEGPKGETLIESDGKTLSPTYLLASLLSRINTLAKIFLLTRDPIKTVITIPHDFTNCQKKEMEVAVKTAGFDLLSIVDQSIAAAQFVSRRKFCDVIVVSFGGQFHLSYHGLDFFIASDPFLGGRDFDKAIFEYILEKIQRKYNVDLSKDKVARILLMEEAERAKIILSSSEETRIEVHHLHLNLRNKPAIILTRSKFESLVDHLVERMKILCLDASRDVLGWQAPEEVLLIGGLTKIPLIQRTIKSLFNTEPNKWWDPLEVVAFGAALEGAFMLEDQRELLSGTIHLSLGFEDSNGKFRRMINRGAVFPTRAKSCVSATCETQKSLCIRVFQGEHHKASYNDPLGEVILSRLPPLPVGFTFDLVFEISKVGVLNVSLGNECLGVSIKSFQIPKLSEENARDKVMDALFSNMEPWGFYETELKKWGELVLRRANMVLLVKAHMENLHINHNRYLLKTRIDDYLREVVDSSQYSSKSLSLQNYIRAIEVSTENLIESCETFPDADGYSSEFNEET